MANEVELREYSQIAVLRNGSVVPVYSEESFITSQFLDLGVESAAFNVNTVAVSLGAKGTAYQYKFGQAGVDASTANADGNSYLASNTTRDFTIGDHTNVDTVADA